MIVECPACSSRYDVSGRPAGTRMRCRCGREFTSPAPPPAARTLACPRCGAAHVPSERACGHCGSPLAVVACPRCFGMSFAGSRHCVHCGTALDAPAIAVEGDGPRPRRCPACPSGEPSLTARLVGDTLLDECPACGGTWIDATALERVVAEHTRGAVLRALAPPSGAPPAAAPEKVVYRRCPDCATVMARRNFGRRSGVLLDVCHAHGTWFDRDELRRVIEFVASGGLDAARRREIEELRAATAEARRAEGRRGGTGLPASVLSSSSAREDVAFGLTGDALVEGLVRVVRWLLPD